MIARLITLFCLLMLALASSISQAGSSNVSVIAAPDTFGPSAREYITTGDSWSYHDGNLNSRVASAVNTDDSKWWVGKAPFGNMPDTDFAYRTYWPEGTILWVRKTLDIPEPTDLRAYIGIDNGYELYWNGTLIHQANSGGRATRWNSIVDIPASSVVRGKNVIALRLIDQGFECAFDMTLIAGGGREHVTNPANGHRYVAVAAPAGISWSAARASAEDMTVDGVRGHLATITSADENAFIATSFPKADGYWLGGYQSNKSKEPNSNWRWATGEPWDYSAWGGGEPNNQNGIEDMLEWKSGGWNDAAESAPLHGYIVEFDTPQR